MTPSAPLSLAGLLLALLLSAACSDTTDPSVLDLTNRNADFAARLYRAVACRTDDNFVLSPFTLSAGLLALLSGAQGPTRDQLMRGLTLAGLGPETIPDLFQTLRNVVLPSDGSTSLRQGVAVFPTTGFQVSPTYQDLVQTKFSGSVQSLSYSMPHEAADTVNLWAQQQAGDQFKNLVSNLDPQTQTLVATAACYQTRFAVSFNTSSTQDERFFVDKYHVVMVPMMLSTDKYFLAYDRPLKAGVLKLPMADGAAMLVVLPDEDVDITAVEEEVSADKIRAWIRQLKKTKLEAQLPRFLLESSYSLKDFLQTFDINQVFQDDADLSGMGGAKGPKLTQVYHKAVITVDETSEGRATTFSTPPPRLTLNRPFIFIVYQEATCSLLFIGRVSDPTQK